MRIVLAGGYPEEEGRVRGGVEAVSFTLARELGRREGIELHVVTVRRSGRPDETRRVGGYTVHLLAKANRLPYSLRVTGADPRRVLAKFREIQPDLVHANGVDAPAVAALKGGYPTLLCVHGIASLDVLREMKGTWDRARLFQARRLERICLSRARHMAAISRYAEEVYGPMIRAEVELIENPVQDPYFELPLVQPTQTVLYAGAIRPLKGVHFLIEAFAEVASRCPEAQLRLAGGAADQSLLESLMHLADELGLRERVHFLGHLGEEELLEEYARCQVFCLPSTQENSPVVIQQAMAAGRPVVSTRVAGIPRLVAEGKSGFLTAAGDIPATVEALCRALQDTELTRQMGAEGKRIAEGRFRLRVIVDKTVALYEKILAEERKPTRRSGEVTAHA